jgi:TatD DNase family protein
MYIDTHSHIYEEEFRDDREVVVERARRAGVERIVLPDIDSQSRGRMLELAGRYPEMMVPLAGLHPTSVGEGYERELALVEREVGTGGYYGIGECGLDLYWDTRFYREQVKVLEHQLGIARDMGWPVVLHARNAMSEMMNVLRRHSHVRGILHCFPGTAEEAREAIDRGFLLGIGGVVTFKKSGMAEVVREIGARHLVLETDSPYLAPVPHRGKRNESGYLPLIAAKIAELTGDEVENIRRMTTENAVDLFNLHIENR